ncbi:unnamed protein product, partial [Schistosoma mattheei]
NDLSIVASYDRRGRYIYTGNSKGKVSETIFFVHFMNTYHFSSLSSQMLEFRIFNKSTVRFNRYSINDVGTLNLLKSLFRVFLLRYFLLNCADRVIRVYNCEDALNANVTDPEPIKKLKDLVTGSHWRKCCFSGDGEYICAGSMKQHSIYLWERASGTLVKILHGQKGETLLDVVWHPLRPIIVSISNSVTKEQVSIWAQTQVVSDFIIIIILLFCVLFYDTCNKFTNLFIIYLFEHIDIGTRGHQIHMCYTNTI